MTVFVLCSLEPESPDRSLSEANRGMAEFQSVSWWHLRAFLDGHEAYDFKGITLYQPFDQLIIWGLISLQ